MTKFTSEEHYGLDEFLRDAFGRVEAGNLTADDAHGHALHALTAFDKSNAAEVVPYMSLVRKKMVRCRRLGCARLSSASPIRSDRRKSRAVALPV